MSKTGQALVQTGCRINSTRISIRGCQIDDNRSDCNLFQSDLKSVPTCRINKLHWIGLPGNKIRNSNSQN